MKKVPEHVRAISCFEQSLKDRMSIKFTGWQVCIHEDEDAIIIVAVDYVSRALPPILPLSTGIAAVWHM